MQSTNVKTNYKARTNDKLNSHVAPGWNVETTNGDIILPASVARDIHYRKSDSLMTKKNTELCAAILKTHT